MQTINIARLISPDQSGTFRALFGPGQINRFQDLLERSCENIDQEHCQAVFGRNRRGYRLIEITQNGSCSVALDLGTTNIAGILYDNVTKEEIGSLSIENPQIRFGSDILTRMHAAMSGKNNDVHSSLISGVNDLIAKMCLKGNVRPGSIHGLSVAGNTAMSHFFLGLDISTIPVAPFEPAVRKPGFVKAIDVGLNVHPEAAIYVFPNAGSYVGGDIIAGILASGMDTSVSPCVLIDVGTNAEIVIGGHEWILVGAGAAGPALEEGISMVGKRAGEGIIYDIEIDQTGTQCHTFDGREPLGICGSGMVSFVYELFKKGIIDERGILNTGSRGVNVKEGERSFTLFCNGKSGTLTIQQREIDNFLRSKAAMFTLLLVLIRTVGLEFHDIKKVYVSGALGTGINVDKALGIGMLPRWPHGSFVPLGNSSLEGARRLLSDASLLQRIDEVTERITYRHMYDDPEFMKEFMGAVFLPHTNPAILDV